MPTPSDSTDELLIPSQIEHLLHSSCPPEVDRPAEWRAQVLDRLSRAGSQSDVATTSTDVPIDDESSSAPRMRIADDDQSGSAMTGTQDAQPEKLEHVAAMCIEASPSMIAGESPRSFSGEERQVDDGEEERGFLAAPTSSILDLSYSNRLGLYSSRLIQSSTSSMLRPGSKFKGTQQSDSSRYSVEVDIKTVDMSESSICGYLKIDGLTPEHATLTTCFEGEIIGPKFTFQTRHEDWGATDKDDMKAWARFPAWRAVGKQAKKSADFHYKNSSNRENVFMRWKEKFLVPDYRVREITGASFEGFYYICFNQVLGTISGIYYHSKTDNTNNKIQQLELKWVPDRGCLAATEFR